MGLGPLFNLQLLGSGIKYIQYNQYIDYEVTTLKS